MHPATAGLDRSRTIRPAATSTSWAALLRGQLFVRGLKTVYQAAGEKHVTPAAGAQELRRGITDLLYAS